MNKLIPDTQEVKRTDWGIETEKERARAKQPSKMCELLMQCSQSQFCVLCQCKSYFTSGWIATASVFIENENNFIPEIFDRFVMAFQWFSAKWPWNIAYHPFTQRRAVTSTYTRGWNFVSKTNGYECVLPLKGKWNRSRNCETNFPFSCAHANAWLCVCVSVWRRREKSSQTRNWLVRNENNNRNQSCRQLMLAIHMYTHTHTRDIHAEFYFLFLPRAKTKFCYICYTYILATTATTDRASKLFRGRKMFYMFNAILLLLLLLLPLFCSFLVRCVVPPWISFFSSRWRQTHTANTHVKTFIQE